MANRSQFKMSIAQRQVRHFSDAIKIQKVREVESGQTKISEIVNEYEVAATTVYKWMKKFGTMKKKPERLIIEADSDTAKLLELKKKVAELERTIGQKQILIDFKDKMIELAEEHYKIDIKKNFSTQQSSSTGNTGKK